MIEDSIRVSAITSTVYSKYLCMCVLYCRLLILYELWVIK